MESVVTQGRQATQQFNARPKNSLFEIKNSPKTTSAWNFLSEWGSNILGIQYSAVEIRILDVKQTTTHVRVEIPFFGIALQIRNQFNPTLCQSITSYGFPRIIPNDSEFLKACERGDC